ncbi:MAG: single-stranded-DNA-specific exonuclease [Flavobacteriales bacterium]|jgi:single-stranded-DNA-specific exonuclease
MKEKVIVRRSIPPMENVESLSESELQLQKIFAARGVMPSDKRDYVLQNLFPPNSMAGIEPAVTLLIDALKAQSRIVIVGDFDADGATSTALLMRSLLCFGFNNVEFIVPNRFEYGYGLTPEIVDLAQSYQPKLIITVDNGISSVEGVDKANDYGIKVLVTDHHLPGRELPRAAAIVNPNQFGCKFPSKNMAGVGVIFYVMLAFRAALREQNWYVKQGVSEPNLAQFLDLVALGTVADVVPLDFHNRTLVAQGLQRIRSGACCVGIQAIFKIANRDLARASAGDFGFVIGPRLNAAGRLDDMSLGIRCLLTDDFSEALGLAQELNDLNVERRAIEASMRAEAEQHLKALDASQSLAQKNALCLYRADWHQGVVGILASRIKDKIHRPTIVFSQSGPGILKGSGRSIPGIHLRDALDEVAVTYPGLLSKFGGHVMAAGLSIDEDKLKQFEEAFDGVVGRQLSDEMKSPILQSDGELSENLRTIEFAKVLEQAGPWGQAFPAPLFDGVFRLVEQKIVGENHLKLLLCPKEFSDVLIDGIAFSVDKTQWPNNSIRDVKLAYYLETNVFRGRESLQLRVEAIELL